MRGLDTCNLLFIYSECVYVHIIVLELGQFKTSNNHEKIYLSKCCEYMYIFHSNEQL